jgi:hypothetical protein
MWEALLIIMFGAVLIYAYSFAKKITYGADAEMPGPAMSVRVQVLNGCGIKGAAGQISEFLRKNGDHAFQYDVVDEGNFATFDVSETLVLDRGDAAEAARAIGTMFGVSEDRVLRQTLPENILDIDVTVVLGRDFSTLDLTGKRRP